MANVASPLTSYSDTTAQKRAITDYVSMIDPSDAPMIQALGGLDGAASKFNLVNWPGTKVEWLEDTLTPLTGTLTVSCASTSTEVVLTVDDPSMYQEGHILLLGSEKMWVSSVSVSDSKVTVTRGFGGTTTATHATTANLVKIVGMARLEGATSDDMGFTDRTTNSNFTQIFHQEIKVSRTQAQISQYGIRDEFDYQAAKAIPSLMRLVELQTFSGNYRYVGAASSTPRSMGGLATFITDNLTSGASLTYAKMCYPAAMSYADGGGSDGWIAPVSPTNLSKIDTLFDTSAFERIDMNNVPDTVGLDIRTLRTPYGKVNLLLDRWATDTEIWYIDPRNAGFITFYPFTQEPLAKTGDYQYGEVVGEFSFLCKLDKSHGCLTAVS
jgi:hypothetical protein